MTTLMEAVAAATADVPRLYPVNGVPGSPTYPYSTYSAALGRGDTYLLDNAEGVRWGRVVVQSFGRSANVFDTAEAVRAALVGATLVVTGLAATPVRSELDPAVGRDPDDRGVVGVTATYTFTATKEA